MSEFHVQVVRIGKVGKHPNADTLSITQVNGQYPVIFKSGAFEEGGLAVHVPPDAMVPTAREEFSWLADKAKEGFFRVKFTKIRNVPSFGFLVPLPPETQGSNGFFTYEEGDDLQAHFGIEKYTGPDEACNERAGSVSGPALQIPHYDIEGLRKHHNTFVNGEPVVITEKIHGSNGRWVYSNGQLYCGSRTLFREDSVWNRMATQYGLEEILKMNEGLVLFGEVYGKGIQDLTYDLEDQQVRFFDVYDSRVDKWFSCSHFEFFCAIWGLPTAPVLYRGPWIPTVAIALAEGQSTIASHVREGIVIKPFEERTSHMGRVFLKLPGEGYLSRKSG